MDHKLPRKLNALNTFARVDTLTIIIPVFNEEEILTLFLRKIQSPLRQLQKISKIQILFMNNGSTDGSLKVLRDWDWGGIELCCISLTRNFGYENSLWFGLFISEADAFAFLDSDGEDPADLLVDFLNALNEGSYAAIGIRNKREESKLLQTVRRISYRLLSRISDSPFTANAGNFMMIRKRVAESLFCENNSFPLIRASVSRAGYKTTFLTYDRIQRLGGKSKFNKLSLARFGVAAFLTTTTWPLRFAAYNTIVLLSFGAIYVFLSFFIDSIYTLVLPTFLIVQALILINLASVSLYIARIYRNGIHSVLDSVHFDPITSFVSPNFKFSKHFIQKYLSSPQA